jgi:hypothetical protein
MADVSQPMAAAMEGRSEDMPETAAEQQNVILSWPKARNDGPDTSGGIL